MAADSEERRWALKSPEAISVRHWPDGSVVYDARESFTWMLSPQAGAVIDVLKLDPAPASVIHAAHPEAFSDLQEVADLLSNLSDHGIVHSAQ